MINGRVPPAHNQKGTLIIGLAFVISLIVASMTITGFSSLASMQAMLYGRIDSDKAMQFNAGLSLMAEAVVDEMFQNRLNPTVPEIEVVLKDQIPIMLAKSANFSNVILKNVSVQKSEDRTTSLLGYSAFKGISAPQTILKVTMEIEKKSGALEGRNVKSTITSLISVGAVHIFRFVYFSLEELGYAGSAHATYEGLAHANGDFCFGTPAAWSPYFYDRVTSAGKIKPATDPTCSPNGGSYTANAFVNIVDTFAPPPSGVTAAAVDRTKFAQLVASGAHGCTNCEGSGLAWPEYARTKFKDHVLDSAHGVKPMLVIGMKEAVVQAGHWYYDIAYDTSMNLPVYTNNGRFKLFVDPPRPSDPPNVAQSKIAFKSDIRVIDGVWYLRDLSDPSKWPGIPIWSDHPGNFTDPWLQDVGQDQLKAALGWATIPKRFSLYEYDPTGPGLYNDNDLGVISYGALQRRPGVLATSDEPWVPAMWTDTLSAASEICGNSALTVTGPTVNTAGSLATRPGNPATGMPTCNGSAPPNPAAPCVPILKYLVSAFSQLPADKITCAAGGNPSTGTLILNSARGGFIEPSLLVNSDRKGVTYTGVNNYPSDNSPREERSRMLPMNFNVRQFMLALKDTTKGELGWHFTGSGRKFNGIIYVSLTWPGADSEFGTEKLLPYHPAQGSVSDPDQMATTSSNQQRALPFQLCSMNRINEQFDTSGKFRIPDCASYAGAAPAIPAFPNMVRFYNGKDLEPNADPALSMFPAGLSLITNRPAYLMGDFNRTSDTNSGMDSKWTPAMLGTDYFTNVSNNWSDERTGWSTPAYVPHQYGGISSSAAVIRTAVDTYQKLSFLGGGGPAEVESWGGRRREIIGSINTGFWGVHRRTYRQQLNPIDIGIYSPSSRTYTFDPHLEYHAPPGTPAFLVTGTLTTRDK